MAERFRVLGWNVENFGSSKYNKCGPELIEFIAAVIREKRVSIAGLSEIRSNMGAQIGQDLATRLGAAWAFQESAQHGAKRLEQYLFVWDTAKHGAKGTVEFREHFYSPPAGAPAGKIGFWRMATHRPPFLGDFADLPSANRIAVAIMHSPAPQPAGDPRDAAIALARVDEFLHAPRIVVLGDFNVAIDADQATAHSAGSAAFSALVNAGFAQLLTGNWGSSLPSRKWSPTSLAECVSSPYDQIFAKGIATEEPGIENLIEDVLPSGSAVLKTALQALSSTQLNPSVPNISTVEDAYAAYRLVVSDHFPVSVGIQ